MKKAMRKQTRQQQDQLDKTRKSFAQPIEQTNFNGSSIISPSLVIEQVDSISNTNPVDMEIDATIPLSSIRMDFPTNVFSDKSQYILSVKQIYEYKSQHENDMKRLLQYFRGKEKHQRLVSEIDSAMTDFRRSVLGCLETMESQRKAMFSTTRKMVSMRK